MEKLLYGSSDNNSDMLYFSKMSIPDPFFAFTIKNKKFAIISPLEFSRAKKESDFDGLFPIESNSDIQTLLSILKKFKIYSLKISDSFPSKFYSELIENNISLEFQKNLFPEREIKSSFEISQIKKANDIASLCFYRVSQILKSSKILKNKKLSYKGKLISSEFLINEIENLAWNMRAEAKNTIASSGTLACDPHCTGTGSILANSLIVVDIFPKLRDSGYFGDMTRTFLKGEPNDAQLNLVSTVKKAHDDAIKNSLSNVNGKIIHSNVIKFFEENNFLTYKKNNIWHGFFHSTGHGVGLDIHEMPRLGSSDCILKTNNVVTIEPALYYKDIGACRIEDVIQIKKNKSLLLSKFHYDWIIK